MACLICNPGVSGLGWSAALAAAGFEVGETDSLTSLDLSGGGVRWHPSERRSRSGARSLYAGDESSGTYAVDEAVETTAALGPIDLPTDTAPRITFSLWMETEETLGYDRLTVEVQTAGEGPPAAGEQAPLVLLDSDSFGSTTHGRWLPFALDLSAFTGQRVSITFRFATQDQKINGFEGVFLDDLRLWTGCCGGDADCDDGNPCTFGTCPSAGAACTIEPRDACCLLDADCDDGDPCTVDACPKTGGGCTHQVIEGCCQEAADCDDGDACTEDVCPEPGALCRHPSICCEADADCKGGDPCLVGRCTQDGCVFEDICCQGDEDCDDDDPCTFDICGSDGACRNKVKSAPGCCDPTPYSEGFDGSAGPSGGGYTFQSTSPPVGWQVVTGARFTSPTGSLYYGDPVAGDFDSGGVNSGTALGPVIELQEAMGHQLGFQLWFDGESGSSFDVLEVFVRTENDSGDIKDFRVWRKSSSDKKKTFHAVSANLSAFAGRSIQIVFRFDTKDGLTNKGEGVYVDDVAVTSTCAALLCLGEKDCEDGVEGTTGSCASGICTYALTGGADPGGGSSGGGGSETCSFSSDCDDGVSCTFDFCVSGTCESIDFCFF